MHKLIASKVLKRKLERKAHEKIVDDDCLKEVDSSRTRNILSQKLSKRK